MYNNAVTYVQQLLASTLAEGDVVIDATMGNGKDTAFMAECVGATGVVYGFDIQQVAIDVTQTRVKGAKADVRLLLQSHEHMLEAIDAHHIGRVAAITFNLGYLPGGDRTITTLAQTTLNGLEQARMALSATGVMTVVCYRHAEGIAELDAVRLSLSQWAQQRYTVIEVDFINQVHNPPVVFVVTGRPHNLEGLSA